MNKFEFEEGKIITGKFNNEFPINEKEYERFKKVLQQEGVLGLLNFNVSTEYKEELKKYNEDFTAKEVDVNDVMKLFE